MMRSRGKDILLLAVALVALVVAVYTFRGKPRPTVPPPPAPEQPADQETASATQEGAEQPEEALAGTADRNPFSAPGAAPAAGITVEAGPSAAEEGVGEETAGRPTEGAEAAGEAQASALSLTGIVAGKPAVAIIRDNGQRYFVKVGDQVGDRYRVQAIGRQEVVLAGQQGKVTLRMGGRQ
jgi:hypothetical protein